MDVFSSTATMLVSTLGGLYLLAILLRFLLQVAKADFYNPISQAVVRITNPTVKLFRMFVPSYKGVDFSSLALAVVVELVLTFTLILLTPVVDLSQVGIGQVITWAFVGVLLFIINIYFWAIIASIIMSFIMMFSGNMNPHPALQLIWQLTEPVMAPVRRIIPPMGGLDFSPIFIFIGIQLIRNVLIQSFGINGAIAMVVVGI